MKKTQLLILFLGLQSYNGSWKNNGFYTIYLVRHSEKEVSASMYGSDPPLTPCGKKRSESLSNFLKDVPIEVIYSTDYTRTKNTALPTAQSKGLIFSNMTERHLKTFQNYCSGESKMLWWLATATQQGSWLAYSQVRKLENLIWTFTIEYTRFPFEKDEVVYIFFIRPLIVMNESLELLSKHSYL